MNSKYVGKNSKLSRFTHDIAEEGDLFVEIDFLDYDYLVLLDYRGGNLQFNFGKEAVQKSKIPFIKKRYYVLHTWAFSIPEYGTSRVNVHINEVLEEMVRIKEGKTTFEGSFLYVYYREDRERKEIKRKQLSGVDSYERKLKTFRD